MPNRQETGFPKKFLWGVSSSAHQVEGAQSNQWTVWELENAKALAAQAPYHYDDLESWARYDKQASEPSNYVSDKAANHYELYERDLELVRKMNMNTFRLSVEWSRIQPQKDAWDVAEVEHYKSVLAACKERGIEPIVTLFHFTLPVWFVEMGGFEKSANGRLFVDYAARILEELGMGVKYVITMNEPETYVRHGYLEGLWPPQVMNKRLGKTVLANLAKAHNQIADTLHAASRRYKVSIAKNYSYIYPGDDAWLTVRAASYKHRQHNESFLNKVIKTCDFIGINYYLSERVYGYRVHNPDVRINDVGWDMQPQYLARVLEELHEKYDKPIFVTENGLADGTDVDRTWWLTQTMLALQAAIKKGVPVIGYLYSNLTDGFEWEKGKWPQFGLFAVNPKTMERVPRPSALWLAKTLKKLRG